MNDRYPSSVLVALYAALGVTVIFLIGFLLAGMEGNNLFIWLLSSFTTTFVLLTLILEFFVYRKLKLLNADNKREIQKLKEMEAFRREFLGDVSHELKTPIFAVQGFIETLLDGALDDKKVNRKFLQKARKHADRLSHLVEDLLVITQIETGDLEMNMEPFVLYDLILEIVDSMEYKLTRKGRNLECKVITHGHEDTEVMADYERIDQVLRNLLDNAVKYGSATGTITVEFSDYQDHKILVKVRDQGEGIPPEHLPRIFERFYRVDKSRSRERGGTGLGLSICKHFVEAHKEQIWVESKMGEGTTFLFTLSKANH
jgi:two-component system phosphate regulon sensor histidine kinase PhoR